MRYIKVLEMQPKLKSFRFWKYLRAEMLKNSENDTPSSLTASERPIMQFIR